MAWSKESRHKRGYGTAWDKLRAYILKRDHYLCQCQYCKAANRVTAATEVDHVVSKAKAQAMGWTRSQVDDPSNLASINKDCHKRKTIEDQGGQHKPKVTIGLDGWPAG